MDEPQRIDLLTGGGQRPALLWTAQRALAPRANNRSWDRAETRGNPGGFGSTDSRMDRTIMEIKAGARRVEQSDIPRLSSEKAAHSRGGAIQEVWLCVAMETGFQQRRRDGTLVPPGKLDLPNMSSV